MKSIPCRTCGDTNCTGLHLEQKPVTPTKAQKELASGIHVNASLGVPSTESAQLIAESEARAVADLKHRFDKLMDQHLQLIHDKSCRLLAEVKQACEVERLSIEVEKLKAANCDLQNKVDNFDVNWEQQQIFVRTERVRADCLQKEVDRWTKWREEQPWLDEIRSYEQQVTRLHAELAEERKTSEQHCAKRTENLTGLLNYKEQVAILSQALDDIAIYHSVKDADLCPYGCDAPYIARNALDKTRPTA